MRDRQSDSNENSVDKTQDIEDYLLNAIAGYATSEQMSYLSNGFTHDNTNESPNRRGNLQSLLQQKSKDRLDQSNVSTVAGSLIGGQKSHGKFGGNGVDSSLNAE